MNSFLHLIHKKLQCIYCNEWELSGKEDKPNYVEIYSFTEEKVISLTTSPEFIETSDRM